MEETKTITRDRLGCNLYIDTINDQPDIITQVLGLQPSEKRTKGDSDEKGRINKNNLWIYKIEVKDCDEKFYLNDVIGKMLDVLDSRKDEAVKLLKKYPSNHLLCFAYFHQYNPYFLFDKDLISRIAQYGIDLEFDIYFLP
jgi:hypothetical protein